MASSIGKTLINVGIGVVTFGLSCLSNHMAKKDLDETIAKKSAEAVANALNKES